MDGKWLINYFSTPARYPHNTVRGDPELDPVHISDLMDVCEKVSRLVDRLRIEEFALRDENWTGLVVMYGMDEPEPRHRPRAALERDGFTVTVRRNEYGTSLEVHPRESDLIMTRLDLIIDTIAAVPGGFTRRRSAAHPAGRSRSRWRAALTCGATSLQRSHSAFGGTWGTWQINPAPRASGTIAGFGGPWDSSRR